MFYREINWAKNGLILVANYRSVVHYYPAILDITRQLTELSKLVRYKFNSSASFVCIRKALTAKHSTHQLAHTS